MPATRHPLRALWLAALILILPPIAREAAGQDFRVLEDSTGGPPDANLLLSTTPPALVAPRVLLVGDSWAQYMWDDGSHNDLFDRFGQEDRRALSLSLGSDPGPGYPGPEYAVSGSEARQWADTASYPWIANMVAALNANPTIDLVVLSIGGNDVLAGRPDGGWYKQMDLDLPGSEAAFFDRLEQDTFTIIEAALAVRPNLRVMISSYEYPNFNVGFWCFAYACPKRRDLSRDPNNALITDAELNDMMVRVEQRRIGWVNANPRLLFDHGIGLMHYYYGDGVTGPGLLPYPGQTPPLYSPFPGGNVLRPSLRSNFRRPNGLDADPIHLNLAGYQYKIANETEAFFFPWLRGEVTETFSSEGGLRDGWSDGIAAGTAGVRLGDSGTTLYRGLLSFDTSSLPDDATVLSAALYLGRETAAGTNPFVSGALGTPVVDVTSGSFGLPEVEPGDATALAEAPAAGYVVGSAKGDGYALRVEITGAGLAAIDPAGHTQFRIGFPNLNAGAAADYVVFRDGDATLPPPAGLPTLADYMGSARPFLDIRYSTPVGVPDREGTTIAGVRLHAPSPNPFRRSTTVRYTLDREAPVTIDIVDVSGRLRAHLDEGVRPAGGHTALWDGRDSERREVPAGIYYLRLHAGGEVTSGRVLRVR